MSVRLDVNKKGEHIGSRFFFPVENIFLSGVLSMKGFLLKMLVDFAGLQGPSYHLLKHETLVFKVKHLYLISCPKSSWHLNINIF